VECCQLDNRCCRSIGVIAMESPLSSPWLYFRPVDEFLNFRKG
jgi:hypothetical protein